MSRIIRKHDFVFGCEAENVVEFINCKRNFLLFHKEYEKLGKPKRISVVERIEVLK